MLNQKTMFVYLKYIPVIALLASCTATKKMASQDSSFATEQHRPQIHFSPKTGWMNDPNGMVYYNGTYHLFYQYYPDSTVWGPMHWGHATSKDMMHWQHQPIALYPDSLGYIFSGSAVADVNNTSGFGKSGHVPLVAIFTSHDPKREKEHRNDVENQSIAYSLDEGKTWTKYSGNPVLKNPGIRDFRDPKVSWFEEGKKWIMTLATQDRITFFSSPNLKDWTKESEFGKDLGAHGGVWECPDLFPLNYEGKKQWVLVVNLNPGGPNGGSATQYFVGNFDGHQFTPYQTETKWIDYGPDEYAGITWSNTGDRKIFLGWMSNWQYANLVPTKKWRSAMTVPRELRLEKVGENFLVASKPAEEVTRLAAQTMNLESGTTGKLNGPATVHIATSKAADFAITLSNDKGQKVVLGYDKASNSYFIDRTQSGKVSFEKGFAARHTAPRFSTSESIDLTLIIDNASAELFADNGLTVMTEIFFPDSDYSDFTVQAPDRSTIRSVQMSRLKSIYEGNSLAQQ
ncbi:glycoside hydrolase family 32 protein [Flavisolibacter nicotianae]|uniref:glycoside hydrolase family 32 protein n=1 Tax=Flavisolibacter nicotianae TaxID=2364882 RepID=UPI000EB15280|nr:glycoside hydrolase family 32 protein [Flavisolibacter nicotianae]